VYIILANMRKVVSATHSNFARQCDNRLFFIPSYSVFFNECDDEKVVKTILHLL